MILIYICLFYFRLQIYNIINNIVPYSRKKYWIRQIAPNIYSTQIARFETFFVTLSNIR